MKKLFKRLFPSKEMRAYRKMYHRHRKELVQLAKQDRDFDWGWLYEFTIMKIKHMYEYFSEGNNVCQSEESLNEILSQLKHVLNLNEELDSLWNTDGDTKGYLEKQKREQELYEEIYSYIGKYIQWWWD